jgi:type II secretory pathway pseudopilin PulG
MIEVVISVVLLVIFTGAVMVALTTGSATTSDNRARIVAASLAQRELEIVGQEIGATTGAATAMTSGTGLAINPHPQTAVGGGEGPIMKGPAEYPFAIDGELFRVERLAVPQAVGASACDETGLAGNRQMATLVTVTVTWESMGSGSAPHVASKLFAPNKNASTGLEPDEALIAVRVSGLGADSSAAARSGIRVELTGPGSVAGVRPTNDKGCVLFKVKPPSSGDASYTAKLVGHMTGAAYITPGGALNPTESVDMVKQGDARVITFSSYDPAASLTVTVANLHDGVFQVNIWAAAGGAGNLQSATISGSTATFEHLYPGTYTIQAGSSDEKVVVLGPGEHGTATLAVSP